MPSVLVLLTPSGVLLLPLPSSVFVAVVRSASLRFFFGGLGFAPKEEKPIVVAMSSLGGEGEREGMVDEVSGMVVVGCWFGVAGWVGKN